MTKVAKVAGTVTKYTESHDRLTVTAKFPNGDKVRFNASRYRSSMSFSQVKTNPQVTQDQLQSLWAKVGKLEKTLSPKNVCDTLKAMFEKANTIQELC